MSDDRDDDRDRRRLEREAEARDREADARDRERDAEQLERDADDFARARERDVEELARWRHSRRRWKQLHEEREMWMRIRKDKRGWGPWWLQARMRRRIFTWLAFAFLSGAITASYWDAAHWWHAVIALIGLSVMS